MRPVLLGLLGVLVLGAAIWLARDEEQQHALAPPAAEPAAPTPAAAPATAPAPSPAPLATPAPPPLPAPLPPRPSFDVVRIGASGNAVIAGRAAPGAEVIVLDGEVELGRILADARGEWVFISTAPLRPGGRELSLRARNPDGSFSDAPSTVVLVVPEPERDVAGRPAQGQAAAPLAMLVPREADGALRVLQAPAPDRAPDRAPDQPAAQAPAPQPAAPQPSTAQPPAAQIPAVQPVPAVATPTPTPTMAPPPALAPTAAPAPAPAPPLPAASTPPPAVVAAAPPPAPTLPAGRPPAGVSVDIVDYAEGGDVQFAGRAGPNGAVRLYLDNRHIGDTAADSDGRWNLRPAEPIAPGVFELRADQVDPGGRVTARVQLPFQRAEPAQGEAARASSVVVQPGQNLWRIARQTYGRGVRYTVIYGANRDVIRDPSLIYPGQVFALPPDPATQR